MKTNYLQTFPRRYSKYRYWLFFRLWDLYGRNLLNKEFPYWLMKWLLWLARDWSIKNLRELGLFMIPSPNGDEHEGPYEVGVKIHWYPFKPIPNVKSFEVGLSALDPVFAMFGIMKRFSPTIKFSKYTNHRHNRYMEHCLRRLHKARVNPELYFRIADSLIRHSRVFFIRGLMLTKPRWHREVPYYIVLKWYKSYRKIARNPLIRINYHRVFIPKPNGKMRPLGVPTVPWRIYLGLWNKFLLKFVEGKINKSQHAYQPDKGTITVWRQIMEEIIPLRNIYSGDLEKYFDKINLDSCYEVLKTKFKVPEYYARYFWWIHKSVPVNLLSNVYEPLPVSKHLSFMKTFKDIGPNRANKKVIESVGWPLILERLAAQYFRIGIGIPQGSPISPLLAVLIQELNYFPTQKKDGAVIAQYSDDLIVGSNNDHWKPKLTFKQDGILEAPEKSHWVKKNGKWLRPLDFCGLRYDGSLDQIIANTRSGSRLQLKDVNGLVPLLEFREILPDREDINLLQNRKDEAKASWVWAWVNQKWSNPRQIIKHQVFGLLQSRLYSGSWELENYEQDFRLTASRGSLVSMHYRHLRKEGVNVFTSTSWAFPIILKDLGESRRKSLRRWRMKKMP